MQAYERVRCKEHRIAKFKKTKTGKKKKKVKVSQSDSHTLTVPHKKKKMMLSFILSFISFIPFFITYKFIQSFSEIKRERVREKNLEGGQTTGGGGSNEVDEHRSRLTGAEAEAQTADGRAIYGVYDVDLR